LFSLLLAGLGIALAAAMPAQAQMTIDIIGVGSQQIPLAVTRFGSAQALPVDLAAVVRADLVRSGLFRVVDSGDQALDENTRPDMADWRRRGADDIALGQVLSVPGGGYDIRYRLYDAARGEQVDALAYASSGADLRQIAHRIADRIYERLTGFRGAFNTRIAYVVRTPAGKFELQVADADGANPQTALRSPEPLMSPKWSPDGSKLAYVSFEAHRAAVYVHDLLSGQRKRVAFFSGSNSAPAFSPDGQHLAVVLTKDGNSEIYLMNADGSNLQRVTRDPAIDTEPTFSPDGSQLYFVSDRSGGPQIYRMPVNGGNAERVTFRGDYNISPRVSADGKTLLYVSRRSGVFQVQSYDLNNQQELTITDTYYDESPSFAPNGRLVLYATEYEGRNILALASPDGRVRVHLSGVPGEIREPVWGPFLP
jgi:TolB protein